MDTVRWCDAFEAKVSRLASPGGLVLALACGEGLWSPWAHASSGREWGKNFAVVRKCLDDSWQYFLTGVPVSVDIENTVGSALPTEDDVDADEHAIVALLAGSALGDLLTRVAETDVEQAGLVSAACFHVIDTVVDAGWVSQANGDELIRREVRRQKHLVSLAVARPDVPTIQRMQQEAAGVDMFAGAY